MATISTNSPSELIETSNPEIGSEIIETAIPKEIEKTKTVSDKKDIDLNKLANDIELEERKIWSENEEKDTYLYPSLNDPLFNKKIAEKKEFNDTKYDGVIYEINKHAEKLCNAEFELSPHQQFVKNFLSFQTPYNSLLLYHGLGSGKTCSAIGVAEEMRDYLNQLGITQRIIVVASPNVQDNFKLQLFDERKLEEVDGLWNIKSCTGNKLLREINPLNLQGLTREKVINQIKQLINSSYLFLGYIEFANYIEKISNVESSLIKNKDEIMKNKLKQNFNNRLIIIDEVHNIRITDDKKRKRVAQELFKLVNNVDNLRLLFLSATPLYNSYKEIIWLINIMNLNDKRSTIDIKDVFDSNGDFKVNDDGEEVGKEFLARKATGYISFVRGDNPYTFPYRIWPKEFAPDKTLQYEEYPRFQLNENPIIQGLKHLSLYMCNLGEYQTLGYNYIVSKLSPETKLELDKSDKLGYIQLQRPLEALNIVYPNEKLYAEEKDPEDPEDPEDSEDQEYKEPEEITIDDKELVGKHGLDNTMTYSTSLTPPSKTNFKYKDSVLDKYGRIFSPNEISKYSSKIKEICNNIMNSEGVILIYSQYLDGGLVPIALALEELGITRHGSVKSLFATPPVEKLDLKTYTNTNSRDSVPAKYIMITGDKMLSPNNVLDLKAATSKDNVNGEKVKVILISQAGSEGLDFKFIRQVHVLEPWYNLSRIEQIIGRAVRHCSHKDLPFEKRNVEIFLYGSHLYDEEREAADLYVYRLAEQKAVQIGHVNRILKEIAVDCLLNSGQQNFTLELLKQTVIQILSNKKNIDYSIGDKPFSAQCDYMKSCLYQCKPTNIIGEINELSYSQAFVDMNTDKIIYRIKQIMKDGYFYSKDDLIQHINIIKPYPIIQIYAALTQLVTDKNEFITDRYGRLGNLVNIGDYYYFQPIELTDKNISIFERSVPIPFKHNSIKIPITDKSDVPFEDKILSEAAEDVEASVADAAADAKKLSIIPEVSKEVESIKEQDKSESIKPPQSLPPAAQSGKKILQTMFDNYNIAKSDQLVTKSEDNWYKYSSIVMKKLRDEQISEEILDDILISHLIETQFFRDTLNILNYLYSTSTLTKFEESIKNYFDSKLLHGKDIKGLFLLNWDKEAIQQLVIFDGNLWKLAEPEDYRELKSSIKESIVPEKDRNNIFGFITNFKNKVMIFKTKENKARHSGARCDQGLKVTAEQLNKIRGEKYYNDTDIKKMRAAQLCVLAEYLYRLNDHERKDGKRWFLTPVEAILTNIKE